MKCKLGESFWKKSDPFAAYILIRKPEPISPFIIEASIWAESIDMFILNLNSDYDYVSSESRDDHSNVWASTYRMLGRHGAQKFIWRAVVRNGFLSRIAEVFETHFVPSYRQLPECPFPPLNFQVLSAHAARPFPLIREILIHSARFKEINNALRGFSL